MRTYTALTDHQLIELAGILTRGSFSLGATQVDRDFPESDHHILLKDTSNQEITLNLKTGQVRYYVEDTPVHLYNMFQFVDKCREFGLPY